MGDTKKKRGKRFCPSFLSLLFFFFYTSYVLFLFSFSLFFLFIYLLSFILLIITLFYYQPTIHTNKQHYTTQSHSHNLKLLLTYLLPLFNSTHKRVRFSASPCLLALPANTTCVIPGSLSIHFCFSSHVERQEL